MRFVLHDSEEITLWDSGDMSVPVANGLFNVELDVDPGDFNGQELWLVVFVDGEALLPRQQILPVPYALSLRPGAQIEGDGADPVTTVINHGLGAAIRAQGAAVGIEATGMTGIEGEGDVGVRGSGPVGVWGQSAIGPGVYGQSDSTSPGIAGVYGLGAASSGLSISQEAGVLGDAAGGFGVAGLSNNSYGGYFESKLYHGVYAKTGSAHYAAIRAVNTGSGDEAYGVEGRSSYSHGIYGKGGSDPGDYGGYFVGDSGIYAEEEEDAGEDYAGYFVGDVRITDELVVDGPARGFFPRPAYDSKWVAFTPGQCKTLTHNLGGDVDNYVVDMQFKDTDGVPWGINIRGHGDHNFFGDYVGGHWHSLTTTTIRVCRLINDTFADQIRVRIWVYK